MLPKHLAVGVLVCVGSALAPATTLAPTTTAKLIERAERVCCARCDAIEARKDPRSGIVFTHVRLTLLEDMKGVSPAGTIALRLVGGRADGVETAVAGMPRFRVGAESVLLLGKRNRDGYPVVMQARRGVLHLSKDKRGTRFVANTVTGVEECKGKGRIRLDALRAGVKRLVRDAAARAQGGK